MPGIDEALSVKKEPFHGEEQALCRHPHLTALNMPLAIIQEPEFIIVQDLRPPVLKRDPVTIRDKTVHSLALCEKLLDVMYPTKGWVDQPLTS